ncbi:hypothetical protein [Salinispora vitiensis]|uniref:hypothetical protein n=1 Tax=Salinispora vitiensis TaxID=999544 RepID=UPI0013A55D1A|nr:hypothetical protein [Salinispora vitiensis]
MSSINPGDMIEFQVEKGSLPMVMQVVTITLATDYMMIQGVVEDCREGVVKDHQEVVVIAGPDAAVKLVSVS